MQVSVSFLNADNLAMVLDKIAATDADYVHVDLIDGVFVPNQNLAISDLVPTFKEVLKPLDVHLMVKDPYPYLAVLKDLNVRFITVHYEAGIDISSFIEDVHHQGIGVGLAINPETPVDVLTPYLADLDYVLVMGVMPGASGQELLSSTTEKLTALKTIREKGDYHFVISFDGGVTNLTRNRLNDADILVAGSYVRKTNDYQAQIDLLR